MASKTFGKIFLKTLGVLSFCAVTSYVLFLAYGYNLDLQHNNIEKRSLVDISSKMNEVRVYFDDKLIGNMLPLQIKDLVPGTYHLDISKLGYLPWNRDLTVQTDLVTKVDDVVLVPEHPETLVHQLARFPEKSRYFTGKDFFIVLAPNSDYLTLVYLLQDGAMSEEELKLSRKGIKDVRIYNSKR